MPKVTTELSSAVESTGASLSTTVLPPSFSVFVGRPESGQTLEQNSGILFFAFGECFHRPGAAFAPTVCMPLYAPKTPPRTTARVVHNELSGVSLDLALATCKTLSGYIRPHRKFSFIIKFKVAILNFGATLDARVSESIFAFWEKVRRSLAASSRFPLLETREWLPLKYAQAFASRCFYSRAIEVHIYCP